MTTQVTSEQAPSPSGHTRRRADPSLLHPAYRPAGCRLLRPGPERAPAPVCTILVNLRVGEPG